MDTVLAPGAAPTAPAPPRKRLGDLLVERGLLSSAALDAALAAQRADPLRPRLGQVLLAAGQLDDRRLAWALAELHGLPMLDVLALQIDPDAARLVPQSVAERSCVLVYRQEGGVLSVVVADPVDVMALDDIRTLTGAARLVVGVGIEREIREALAAIWSANVEDDAVHELLEELPIEVAEHASGDAAPDAASIRLVDRMIVRAAQQRASDIHLEPMRDGARVRYRVDGVLHDVLHLPAAAFPSVLARVKVISHLDIADRRRPQDGRARVRVDGQILDMRVSTLPSLFGEKAVIRLLPRSDQLPRLEQLGLTTAQAAMLRETFQSPQGLVLITGPTGSGKTNTLYAGVRATADDSRNVTTLEDPVEVELPGITQVPVNEKAGLTFPVGLRSILRQDPDVVLVGEVRDLQTAEQAVRASLTGHLVLTTLHTLDAASAITRLVDMGVPSYLVASSLSLVVSQRLVRRPCSECAVVEPVDPVAIAVLGVEPAAVAGHRIARAVGCPSCHGSGYRGRIALFEMLPVTHAVRIALVEHGTETAVRAAARAEGVSPLSHAAVAAVLSGRTTLREVLRAVPIETASHSTRLIPSEEDPLTRR